MTLVSCSSEQASLLLQWIGLVAQLVPCAEKRVFREWVMTLWVPYEDTLCVANCRQIRVLHPKHEGFLIKQKDHKCPVVPFVASSSKRQRSPAGSGMDHGFFSPQSAVSTADRHAHFFFAVFNANNQKTKQWNHVIHKHIQIYFLKKKT